MCQVNRAIALHISTVPPKAFPGKKVTVLEGNDTLLRCEVEGNPAPQVIWFAPNGTVLQNQTSGTNLTLEDVSHASHGTYNCTVKNYLGSESGTVHLNVKCKLFQIILLLPTCSSQIMSNVGSVPR